MDSIPMDSVYIVQVAQLGGTKLGFEDDPEGAWIDHDVFLDREEAERVARIHETAPLVDEEGRDVTAERITIARVVTGKELGDEFGAGRVNQMLTIFRQRLTELMADAGDS
jgi:hypothetical protein